VPLAQWLSVSFGGWIACWAMLAAAPQDERELAASNAVYGGSRLRLDNEFDLQATVVARVRSRYASHNLFLTPGMPHMPSPDQRRAFFQMGYTKGQPDLLIMNASGPYAGFALEFKTPLGHREPSAEQNEWLAHLRRQGWKTLVSNDLVDIMLEIDAYVRHLRVACACCGRLFASARAAELHSKRKRDSEE
jgi:hypothetical protein